jgi:hypothetical protein
MQYALKIVGVPIALTHTPFEVGHYVKVYQANGNYGRGFLETTDDLDKAIHFADAHAALECWRAISTTHPKRPDGKPNRPLTAFSVELIKLDQ